MTPDEQERMIVEIERDLERLHALYNQYFMGIEKTEPAIPRKNLDRKIYTMRREQILNTALRFRFQMQIQKYNTQSTYWNRVCKQIENGTYQRQIMLAKRRVEARHGARVAATGRGDNALLFSGETSAVAHIIAMDSFDIDLDEPFGVSHSSMTPPASAVPGSEMGTINTIDDPFADELGAKSAAPVASRRANSPALLRSGSPKGEGEGKPIPGPVPAKPGQLPPEMAKAVYKKYIVARKRCNEPVDSLSFEKVAKSLQKSYSSAGSHVDFKVVIRNGKAVIKTVKSKDNS